MIEQIPQDTMSSEHDLRLRVTQLIAASNRQDRALAWLLNTTGSCTLIADALGADVELYYRNIFYGIEYAK